MQHRDVQNTVMATWHIRSQNEQFASGMISLFSHFPFMKRCNDWRTGEQGFPFSVNMHEDTSAIKQEPVVVVSCVRGNEDRSLKNTLWHWHHHAVRPNLLHSTTAERAFLRLRCPSVVMV